MNAKQRHKDIQEAAARRYSCQGDAVIDKKTAGPVIGDLERECAVKEEIVHNADMGAYDIGREIGDMNILEEQEKCSRIQYGA